MTGLMKRIFRRRKPGQPPRRGVATLFRGRRARGQRLPGYRRIPAFGLPLFLKRWPPWRPAPAPAPDPTQPTQEVAAEAPPPSFKDRGQLRRRLRFLRRARELGFRDVGGLIFDMRRFERSRPDLLDAKLDALLAVDQELRALERILDDQRAFHELRESGISSCARCGALHSSEANFCPQCGLQFSGPRAMGEVGGAIAAPPQAPAAPGAGQAPAVPRQQEWPWPAAEQPTAPTAPLSEPVTEQLTVAYVPVLSADPPEDETAVAAPVAEEATAANPAVVEEQEAIAAGADQATAAEGTEAAAGGDEQAATQAAAGGDEEATTQPDADGASAPQPAGETPVADDSATGRPAADEQQTETPLPPQASDRS